MNVPHSASAEASECIEIEAAPLWRRAAGGLIDLGCALACVAPVVALVLLTDPEPLEIPPWNWFDRAVDYLHERPGRAGLIALALTLTLVAWAAVFQGLTPGRRALGLRFVDARGLKPTRRRLFAWGLVRLPCLLFGAIGATWALIDVEHRALHDRLLKLWVSLAPDAPFRRSPRGNRRLPRQQGASGWW